ncbi:MAG: carboxypeptidase regulatory-like domain-containing protein [Planctomycetes bacterium]|nr:carboxypeptidase regulatory-like domain-containing protein [Planctomycetota bacterium]
MQSARAPWYVCIASFSTFVIAFFTLAAIVKPKLDERRAERQAAMGRPADSGAEARPRLPDGPRAAESVVRRHARGKVVDPRGTGVANAALVLLDRDHRELAKATSTDDGGFTFEFESAPSMELTLRVSASGFQSAAAEAPSSATATEVAFPSVVLRDGGALRVRVSGDREGALADANVCLLPPEDDRFAALASATTLPDGCALLKGINVGAYRIKATAAGHAAAERTWRFEGIRRDGNAELAFVLLPLTDWIDGSVRDEQNDAIGKGEVIARMVRPDPPAREEWHATVERDGSFRIGPLPSGTFELELRAPGIVQEGAVRADSGESGAEQIEIVASHGGAVAGTFAADAGFRQTPALGLWRLGSDGRSQPLAGSLHVTINAAAQSFRIEGVSPGRYFVRAVADGYAPARSQPFTVAVDHATDDVVLQLSNGAELGGTLIDHRGAPIGGARVTAYEGRSPPQPALAERLPADARTAAATAGDGAFALTQLAPGCHVLVVEAQGQPLRAIGPIWLEDGTETRLPRLALTGGTVLSLTLADGDGRAAKEARVRITAQDLGVDLCAVADQDGNVCVRGLPAGNYWLTPGDGSEPLAARLVDSETTRLELFHSAH